jgi:hypothetical protein
MDRIFDKQGILTMAAGEMQARVEISSSFV